MEGKHTHRKGERERERERDREISKERQNTYWNRIVDGRINEVWMSAN